MRGKRILILGGLGFIGKNLFLKLREEEQYVTILSNHVEDIGDGFPISQFKGQIAKGDILDKTFMEGIVRGYDVIYSLAGSSGASDSIKNPYLDLDTNLKGHLNVLEACRKYNEGALLVFPSSRLVYGKPEKIPVAENHPMRPESIYAIHKLTTEHYYLLYQRLYGLKSIIFRIGNPYGPYQKFGGHHYGILNWFIHHAMTERKITIYGDGSQKRDFIHINDLVDVLIASASNPNMPGKIYNVGFGAGASMKDAAEVVAKNVSGTELRFVPWPELDKKIETGDYITDIGLLQRELGWMPKVDFESGIRMTVEFYKSLK